MTNTTYFYNTIREEWSASTSPNDSPRRSFVDVGNITLFQEEASSSSSSYSTDDVYDGDGGGCLSTSDVQIECGKLDSSHLKSLSFKQIKAATRKFHPDSLVGESKFGQVYQGQIPQDKLTPTKPGRGIAVAVKKLDGLLRFGQVYKAWVRHNKLIASKPEKGTAVAVAVKRINQQGLSGYQAWFAEIKYLGKLYHPNLVRLFGHCTANDQRLLVYEFMPRGSLNNYLFDKECSRLLSWKIRIKIALGAARGLAFLHSSQANVIHLGVTSCNILLDSNYNAKLGNFVFAMDGPTDDMSDTKELEATYGYRAPEYTLTGRPSAKTDVYAFGVVLLEIISGRGRQSIVPSEEQNLLEWVRSYLKDSEDIFNLIDSCLEGQCSPIEAQKAANLAYDCLSMDPKCRPDMNEVVKSLENLQKFGCKNAEIEQNHLHGINSNSAPAGVQI